MEISTEISQTLAGVQAELTIEVKQIVSDAELSKSSNMLRWVKTKAKELTELRLSMTRPLDASKQSIMKLFAPYMEKLESAEAALKKAMITYELSVAEKRKAEQAEENARAAKMEEAQKAHLLDLAESAATDGDAELAERYINTAENLQVDAVNVSAEKRKGTAMRSVWKWRVTDEKLVPRAFLTIDEKEVSAAVRAMRGDTNIPGIEAYEEQILAARSL